MSPKAIIYWNEPLVHRYLVIYKAPVIEDSFLNYAIRSLLTEHQFKYAVPIRKRGNWTTKYIVRQGANGTNNDYNTAKYAC